MDLFVSSAIQILLFVQLSESLLYPGLIGSTYKLANNSGGLTNPVMAKVCCWAWLMQVFIVVFIHYTLALEYCWMKCMQLNK